MGLVGRFGKILGFKGLMLNLKLGIVIMDVVKVVKEVKVGRVEFRFDKIVIIYCLIGKVLFGKEKFFENYRILMDVIIKVRLVVVKG